jgi:hypothetical protein
MRFSFSSLDPTSMRRQPVWPAASGISLIWEIRRHYTHPPSPALMRCNRYGVSKTRAKPGQGKTRAGQNQGRAKPGQTGSDPKASASVWANASTGYLFPRWWLLRPVPKLPVAYVSACAPEKFSELVELGDSAWLPTASMKIEGRNPKAS